MKMEFFPAADAPTQEGLIAIGGEFTSELLIEAYGKGIFPWPQNLPDDLKNEVNEDFEMPILWFSPDPRGILDFQDFHVPESLKKVARRHQDWKITFNQAFRRVIEECQSQSRPDQKGTWILPEMIDAYDRLFKLGYGLSVECWESSSLIGGIYGVLLGGLFSGESMFYKVDNASKLCFWRLVEELQSRGHQWMDIQMVTPVTAQFGGRYISRADFLGRKKAL